jgi:hypothetical protein
MWLACFAGLIARGAVDGTGGFLERDVVRAVDNDVDVCCCVGDMVDDDVGVGAMGEIPETEDFDLERVRGGLSGD